MLGLFWAAEGVGMKIIVRIAAQDDGKAWDLLQRHSVGVALPNRTFIVSNEAKRTLSEAGIRFTEVCRLPK